MKVPKSFIPDSFEPDLPTVEIVPVASPSNSAIVVPSSFQDELQAIIDSVPNNSLQAFSPVLQDTLSAIRNQQFSGGIAAWFNKHGARQRGEQYAAQTTEVNNLINLASAQHTAYVRQVEQAFAPVQLRNRFATELAQHKVTQTTLEYQVGLILISEEIAKRAIAKGQTPEVYLLELQGQVRLSERKQEIEQDVNKDEQLLANKRKDANLSTIDRINRSTEAKMARRLQEKRFREDLDAAIAKRHRIAADSTLSDAMRADFLANVEDEIVGLKDQINELLGRNRQADSREEA